MSDILITIFFVSLFIEYIDATIGMGYGTTLTPILLLIGFSPLQIVPAILLAQFIAGIFAAILHQKIGNVNFDFNKDYGNKIVKRFGNIYVPKSTASKIIILLTISSMVGTIIAVYIAVTLSIFYLKLYIGLLVVIMGIIIIIKHRINSKFSWRKILTLGIIASFNKGISGGGYGPLIVSGQILSGVETKNSISITALAEGITCFIGIVTYFILDAHIDWILAPYLIIGSLISVPISVYTVKKMPVRQLTLIIGIATTILGIFTLIKLFI